MRANEAWVGAVIHHPQSVRSGNILTLDTEQDGEGSQQLLNKQGHKSGVFDIIVQSNRETHQARS